MNVLNLQIGAAIIGAAIGISIGQRFQNLYRSAPFILAAVTAVVFYLAAQVLFILAIVLAVAFATRPLLGVAGDGLSNWAKNTQAARRRLQDSSAAVFAARVDRLNTDHQDRLESIKRLELDEEDLEDFSELERTRYLNSVRRLYPPDELI